MKLIGNMQIIDNELVIGGVKTTDVIKKFGSPVYVFDEEYFETQVHTFLQYFKSSKFETAISYASKSFSNTYIVELVKEKGLFLDVVSGGEIRTALNAEFDPNKIRFHGNNKLSEEITYALENGIDYFIIDSEADFNLINKISKSMSKPIRVLLRFNMDVYSTSKFGVNITNPSTLDLIGKILQEENVEFLGIHCHIGGDFNREEIFEDNIRRMVMLAKYIHEKFKIDIDTINFGGGYGTYYVDSDKRLDYSAFFSNFIKTIEEELCELNLSVKTVAIEPGRSLINPSVTTLYTVGNIKEMEYHLPFVFIDGGMNDNPRPGMYGSQYQAFLANRMNEEGEDYYRIAGKSCESDADTLVKRAYLPKPMRGDILAIPCSGAYTYSMSSNYNRNTKPGIVSVKGGDINVVVKREDYDDIIRNDFHRIKEDR